MLSSPQYGWSNITIGDWSDRCSYLDDVPFDLLRSIWNVQATSLPYAVSFDAEGWQYIIVFDEYETHIITSKESSENQYINVKADIDSLASELIDDIRKSIDKWASWTDYGGMSLDETERRKEDLLDLCNMSKDEIRRRKSCG